MWRERTSPRDHRTQQKAHQGDRTVHTNHRNGVEELTQIRKLANKTESNREKAIAYHDRVVPKMDEIRRQIDKPEPILNGEWWTLPKDRELLFIK